MKFRIALASSDSFYVDRHFGKTEWFEIYDVDDEGFVYTSNKDTDGLQAVRRLNPKGEDVIRMGAKENLGGDRVYGSVGNYSGPSQIVDVVYRDHGIYSLLDARRGRIFTYDHEGNLLYIFGGLLISGLPAVCAVFGLWNEAKAGVTGFILLLLCVLAATGLLIYTRMSVPQDVEPFLTRKKESFDTSTPQGRRRKGIASIYWLLVTAAYLAISFATGAWYITWLVWLIASAGWQAIHLFAGSPEGEDAE